MTHPTPTDTTDREIVTSRTVDAPAALVFKVWTSPDHVGAWWGPDGFTTTTHEMDVRPGGLWRFMMHGPDGTDYPNRIDYLEVAPPDRLVYDHGSDDGGAPHFHVVVTFVETNGKTDVTMRSLFPTAAAREAVAPYAIPGAQQTLGRLDAYLASL